MLAQKFLAFLRRDCYAVFAFVALVSSLQAESGRKVTLAAFFFAQGRPATEQCVVMHGQQIAQWKRARPTWPGSRMTVKRSTEKSRCSE
jgi:hypothetical protein